MPFLVAFLLVFSWTLPLLADSVNVAVRPGDPPRVVAKDVILVSGAPLGDRIIYVEYWFVSARTPVLQVVSRHAEGSEAFTVARSTEEERKALLARFARMSRRAKVTTTAGGAEELVGLSVVYGAPPNVVFYGGSGCPKTDACVALEGDSCIPFSTLKSLEFVGEADVVLRGRDGRERKGRWQTGGRCDRWLLRGASETGKVVEIPFGDVALVDFGP